MKRFIIAVVVILAIIWVASKLVGAVVGTAISETQDGTATVGRAL